MPARRKKAKKRAKDLKKKLKLITKEAKKLDCDIRELAQALQTGNYRML